MAFKFVHVLISFQTNSIYTTPYKRTSSNFGSRLWSDLPLPIDECYDDDMDFHQLPELRRKQSDNEKVLRVNSLQPNATQRAVKQPLARNISSPMRFNYSQSKETDRFSGTSFGSTGSKISFRKFLRRMSSRRRNTADAEFMRDKRKSNKTTSIRFAFDLISFKEIISIIAMQEHH